MTYRILVTGSRDWQGTDSIGKALIQAYYAAPGYSPEIVVVHGDCPTGADAKADLLATLHGFQVEKYPGRDFPSFQDRNQFMVDLGADVCLAFAYKWASGTGQTARMARKAGIRTIDYGVNTE
jgi:hypothetical protein